MRNYLKNYKVENPRALRFGLMTTGLSLMKGAGQTYDRPVSTVGLVGEAGLQGLGTYETARRQDILSKQKGLEEKGRERRHIAGITARKDISETEIGARKDIAEYKVGKTTELSKADIAARKSLAEYKAAEAERLTELEFGPESLKARELGLRYGKGGIEEQKIEAYGKEKGFTAPQMANLKKSAYTAADKEIERRRIIGELSFGEGKNRVDMTSDQIAEEREAIASGYFQDYIRGSGSTRPEPGMRAVITPAYVPAAYTPEKIPETPSFTSSRFPATRESPPTRLEMMQRTPQQGFKEMGKSLSSVGLDAENWKATGRLYKDIGKWGLSSYTSAINKILESQKKARRQLPGY